MILPIVYAVMNIWSEHHQLPFYWPLDSKSHFMLYSRRLFFSLCVFFSTCAHSVYRAGAHAPFMMMMSREQSKNNLLWCIACTGHKNDKLLAVHLVCIISGQVFHFVCISLSFPLSHTFAITLCWKLLNLGFMQQNKNNYRINVNAWNRHRQPISGIIMIRRM